MSSENVRLSVLSAACTALISIGSYISIPVGPVPVVLQNFFVLVTGLLLPPRAAVSTVFAYLFMGALGIPVFAGGTGGIGHFFGPTGGYLLGYLPAVLAVSWINGNSRVREARLSRPSIPRSLSALIAGSLAIYLCGLSWFAFSTGMEFPRVLALGLLPFLPGDALKIAAALWTGRRFGPRIDNFLAGV
jgi:biotin transport system substrate-specific component